MRYTPSFLFTVVSTFERILFVRIRCPFDFAGVNENANDLRLKVDSIENKNEGDKEYWIDFLKSKILGNGTFCEMILEREMV